MMDDKDEAKNAIERIAIRAREAGRAMTALETDAKNGALKRAIAALEDSKRTILVANQDDVNEAKTTDISPQTLKRLILSDAKFEQMIRGANDVRNKLEDPVGIVSLRRELDEGLVLERVSCPIGVICIIFEARPEAAVQIATLAIKSGNAVILKGGKEAKRSNRAIVEAIRKGIREAADGATTGVVPEDAVQLVQSREDVRKLLELDTYIDLVIPRGSRQLVQKIQSSTRIPVMGHADGICTVYVDKDANLDKAAKIVVDSKTNYPAACNAAETLLVHRDVADRFLPKVRRALGAAKVTKIYACKRSFPVLTKDAGTGETVEIAPAEKDSFRTEFGCLEIAVKIIDSADEAVTHINANGSGHTDCIVTDNAVVAKMFMGAVDSAGVYHNASTRFADGFRYGFGAEVGVSTNRLHARGPVGMEGLLTYKYRLVGAGHCVADYGQGKREYTHRDLPLREDTSSSKKGGD